MPSGSSSIAVASVIAFKAVLDAAYVGPNSERPGWLGSALRVSEPAPLDTFTMRAAGDSRSRGKIAWMTATTPNTFVSKTERTSLSDTLLERFQHCIFFNRLIWSPSGVGDGRIVDQDVQSTELVSDSLRCRINRHLIRYIELECDGARPRLLGRSLTTLKNRETRKAQ